jgi:transmembrane carrier protein
MTAAVAHSHQLHHVPTTNLPQAIMPQPEKPKRLVKRYRTEIAASTSSVFSTVVAFPLDSVKTRMQTYRYDGFLDCVRHTYRTENLRGFFRGTS